MARKTPISFSEYQKTLQRKGMAIAAHCSHESYGQIIFNQVIKNPATDLLTTMRDQVREALSARFQELNEKFHQSREPDKSIEGYTRFLVEEFAEEQENWKHRKFPNLEWIDNDNPWSGIIFKTRKDISHYFELRVDPRKMLKVWEKELDIEIDQQIEANIRGEIEFFLEEMEIEPGGSSVKGPIDWYEMASLDFMIYQGCGTQTKYRKLKLSYLSSLLSPLLENYRSQLVYVASPDTCYFSIGRPYFYPVIAGERSDGSHEITIFEAVNE